MPRARLVVGTVILPLYIMRLGGVVVRASDLQSTGCGMRFRIPATSPPGNDSERVVHIKLVAV